MKKRFTAERVAAFARQVESGEKSVAWVCRAGVFSPPAYHVRHDAAITPPILVSAVWQVRYHKGV